jgi:hypothetical protein
MAHFGLSVPSIIGVLALLLAWVPPQRVWQWKLALVSQEFGHWLALFCLVGLAGIIRLGDARWRWSLILMSIATCAGLLVPAMLAARVTPGFSWPQLWLSWTQPDPEVRVTREVYWTEGDQNLDLLLYQPKNPSSQPLPCLCAAARSGSQRY